MNCALGVAPLPGGTRCRTDSLGAVIFAQATLGAQARLQSAFASSAPSAAVVSIQSTPFADSIGRAKACAHSMSDRVVKGCTVVTLSNRRSSYSRGNGRHRDPPRTRRVNAPATAFFCKRAPRIWSTISSVSGRVKSSRSTTRHSSTWLGFGGRPFLTASRIQ